MSVRWLIPLVLLIAAACAPSGATTLPPTLTLIPVTATLTPPPVPPTSTPANLPGPQDVIRSTLAAAPADSSLGLTGAALVAADPVAESLVGIAERLVADQTNLPSSLIGLVDVRPVVWTDSALNCPASGSDAVPSQTDGYRIVVQGGSQTFLFHTDVDRVVPCDPANEHLPEGVVIPADALTPEAAATP